MPDAPDDEPATIATEAPRFTRAQLAKAGAAIGVGSAGLIAALLYAKSRQKQAPKPPRHEDFTD